MLGIKIKFKQDYVCFKKGANQCITREQIIAPLKNKGIFNEGAMRWGANQRTPNPKDF